jgi:hypothetical protein
MSGSMQPAEIMVAQASDTRPIGIMICQRHRIRKNTDCCMPLSRSSPAAFNDPAAARRRHFGAGLAMSARGAGAELPGLKRGVCLTLAVSA